MIIFKNYLDIMRKRFPTVIGYGIVLIALILLFDYGAESIIFTDEDQTKVRIAVLSSGKEEEENAHFINYMQQYCEIVPIGSLRKDRMDALYYGNISCIIEIPEGFFTQYSSMTSQIGEYKSMNFQMLENTRQTKFVNQIVDNYLDYIRTYCNLYPSETIESIQQRIPVTANTLVTVVDEAKQRDDAGSNHSYQLLGFVLFACGIIIVCTSMNSYRTHAVYQKHLVAPIKTASLNMGLLLGNIVYTYLYTLVLLGMKSVVSSSDGLTIQTLCHWINTFLYVTGILLFAFLLSFRLKRKMTIYVVANVVGLILAMISGVFIDQEYLSTPLLRLSSLTPMYWFIHGNDLIECAALTSWQQVCQLLKVFGIQALFIAAFFSMILVAFKIEDSDF